MISGNVGHHGGGGGGGSSSTAAVVVGIGGIGDYVVWSCRVGTVDVRFFFFLSFPFPFLS